ncbi:SBBP repeat-containing protein [Candidatus Kapabacteria bacterium]|nr:SBBP repeat-containing protein [Candidatus Kapabacteria bacterium]
MIKSNASSLFFNNSKSLVNFNKKKDLKVNFISERQTHFAYSEILSTNIYEGIDIRFYFKGSRLRFDFIVSPGANPDQIELESSEKLESIKNFQAISKIWGLDSLYTYQNSKENRKYSEFAVNDNKIKFLIGEYDPTQPLVIDPLLYSSYIGGLQIDSGEDIVVDSEGSIIIVGETASNNFPTTLGTYQREISVGNGIKSDIFVTKVDLNYNHIFTTYIGSEMEDFGRGVDVDGAGNIYITGYTYNSNNFPTTPNSFDVTHNGLYDAFVIKLSKDGRDLLNSTFLGSNRDDFGLSIKVMADTTVVVTGYTTQAPDSAAFPSTSDAFNEIYLGKIDGFVTKISKDFDQILWSGFLGGLGDDFPQDLAIGTDSTIYVAGLTRSENFITTDGVLFREYNDNNNSPQHSDAFFTKISNDGTEIILSSVFGGNNGDIAYGMRLDADNNIYIAGETRSSNLPTTELAPFREINRGNDQVFTSDAFVSKFNPDGSEMLFSTYLGGESTDRAFDIGLDGFQNMYLVGTTSSQNFPITEFAYDKELNDSVKYSDIFIAKFNNNGEELDYSTYYGADRSDLAKALQVRSENRIVFTGNTSSTFLETTLDAIQVAYQDSSKADAHFADFFLDDFIDADIYVCSGSSSTLSSDITSTTTTLFYNWSPEESLDDPNKEFPIASPEISTLYTCVVSNTFGEKFVAQVLVAVLPKFETSINGEIDVDNTSEYLYSTDLNSGSIYQWIINNGTINSGQGTNNVFVTWQNAEFGSLRLIETNDFGCKDTATLFTNFSEPLRWEVYPFGPLVFCEGDTILLDSGPTFTNVIWQDGVGGRYDTVFVSGNYSFTARNPDGSIYNSNQVFIEFRERPRKPTIIKSNTSNQLVCISFASNYYWYKDNVLINGNNTRFLEPLGFGCYQVSIENLDKCTNLSDEFCVNDTTSVNYEFDSKIFPNPASGMVHINVESITMDNSFRLINNLGQELFRKEFQFQLDEKLNIRSFSPGVYFVSVNGKIIEKLIIY